MSPAGAPTESSQPSDAANANSPGQTALERLLDIGFYAPLGLLANKGDVVRDFAAEGRKQVAFSRSLGRAALKAVAAGSRSDKNEKATRDTKAPSAAKSSAPAAKSAAPKATSPAIADYGSRTAREIIALIPSCSSEQQEWIEAAERAGKGRVTILRALQSDSS